MKDYDERTIWTSDTIPLVASYHKGFIKISNGHQCLYGCGVDAGIGLGVL